MPTKCEYQFCDVAINHIKVVQLDYLQEHSGWFG